jgi:hypothetical protein
MEIGLSAKFGENRVLPCQKLLENGLMDDWKSLFIKALGMLAHLEI